MKKQRIIAYALTGVSVLGALAGCGKEEKQTNENITLKYVMIGPGQQEDSNKVWAKFNEELHKKLPNVTVDFEVIPIAEYSQKFMLMLASREKVDIASTYGLSFDEEVGNGTFADITELIDKYGKEMRELLPDYLFDYTTYDGKIYGIPTYQMLSVPTSMKTQKALAEKYLDEDGLTAELNSNVRVTDKTISYVTDYLQKLKDNGELRKGPQNVPYTTKGFDRIVDNYGYFFDDEKCTVHYMYQTDEYLKDIKTWHEWLSKGFIREDIKTNDDWNKFTENGWVEWTGNYEPWSDEMESETYGFDIHNIPYSDKYYIPMSNTAGGTAILEACKNKEEAMQVLNLIQSDKDLYNLLVYGIEGEHYTKVGEDEIKTNTKSEYGDNDSKYGLWKWVVGNTQLAYRTQFNPVGYKEWVFDEINSSTLKSKLIGFHPDLDSISDDLTQISSLRSEYYDSSRDSGNMDRYNEWMEKITLAGNQRIIDELQRQVDEFLASNK